MTCCGSRMRPENQNRWIWSPAHGQSVGWPPAPSRHDMHRMSGCRAYWMLTLRNSQSPRQKLSFACTYGDIFMKPVAADTGRAGRHMDFARHEDRRRGVLPPMHRITGHYHSLAWRLDRQPPFTRVNARARNGHPQPGLDRPRPMQRKKRRVPLEGLPGRVTGQVGPVPGQFPCPFVASTPRRRSRSLGGNR